MGDEKDAESRFMKGITKGFFSVMGDHLEIELSFAEKMLNIFLKSFNFYLIGNCEKYRVLISKKIFINVSNI